MSRLTQIDETAGMKRQWPEQTEHGRNRTLKNMDRIDTGTSDCAHFKDTGCDLSPSCFTCPIPVGCRYELPPKQAGRWIRAIKMRPLLEAGKTSKQIADYMNISWRTVYRTKPYVYQLQAADRFST